MRSGLGLILAMAIVWGGSASSARAGSTTQTCIGWKECFILRAVCKKGAFGQVLKPDGSIWGVCVI